MNECDNIYGTQSFKEYEAAYTLYDEPSGYEKN